VLQQRLTNMTLLLKTATCNLPIVFIVSSMKSKLLFNFSNYEIIAPRVLREASRTSAIMPAQVAVDSTMRMTRLLGDTTFKKVRYGPFKIPGKDVSPESLAYWAM
jgi:hypothetical protein